MSWPRLAAGLMVAAALVGCGGGDDDGGGKAIAARIPDVEGVLEAVDAEHVVIDGASYDLAEDASSVSTYTLDPVPARRHTFVHAGLDDRGDVRWLATIGLVAGTTPPRVHYTGRVRSRDGGRALFEDGTALRVAGDLRVPDGFVAVEIDPATDLIVSVTTA